MDYGIMDMEFLKKLKLTAKNLTELSHFERIIALTHAK